MPRIRRAESKVRKGPKMRKGRVTAMFEFELDPSQFPENMTEQEMLEHAALTIKNLFAAYEGAPKVSVVRKETL